jgi:hypothetical protein
MGRSYRTSSAMPLDYMYSINAPLMEKVLMANDQGITNSLTTSDQLGQLKNFKYIDTNEAEKRDAEAIQKEIEDRTTEISKAIQEDPANWKKQLPLLRQYKQDLLQNYTSGPISKLQESYNNRVAKFAEVDKQVELYNKTGGRDKNGNAIGLDPYSAQVYKARWDEDFKGTKTLTGYSTYRGGTAMNNMDIETVLAKGVKDMKDNGKIIKHPTQKGMYLIETEQGWKGLTQTRILEAVQSNFTPELMQYMKNRSDVGLLNNVYASEDVLNEDGSVKYKKGDFINPYQTLDNPASKEELADFKLRQAEIDQLKKKKPQEAAKLQEELTSEIEELKDRKRVDFNPDSRLAGIIKGIATKYAHSEETNKTTIKADPVALPVWKQSQQNQQKALDRQLRRDLQTKTITAQKELEQMRIDAKKEASTQARIDKIKTSNLKPDEKNALINEIISIDSFIADPVKPFEKADLQAKGDRYTALVNKSQKGGYNNILTGQEQEELDQLSLLYNDVAKKLNLTPEQMSDVVKFNSGDIFGSRYDNVDERSTGHKTKQLVPTAKYKQVKQLADDILKTQSKNNSKVKDIADVLAGNVTVKDLAYVPSTQTKEGKATFDLVNKLFQSGVGRAYYKGGETYYNSDGTPKTSTYSANIDGFGNDGDSDNEAGADPLRYLTKINKGNPTDYIKGMKVKIDGNKLIVSGSIDVGEGIKSGHWWTSNLTNSDIEGDAKNFQLVFDDFDAGLKDIYGSSKSFKSNPSGQALLSRFDPNRAIIQNKINMALPLLAKKGQKQTINGIMVENIGNGYQVSLDGGKTYHSKIGVKDAKGAIIEMPIVSPDQLEAIVIDKQ